MDAIRKAGLRFVYLLFILSGFVPVLFSTGKHCTALAETAMLSQVDVPTSRYAFSAVFEGQTVTHDFTILNNGEAPLALNKVETDCGCTAVSYPEEIAPGSKGEVEIKIDTMGEGNSHISKTVTVYTNDARTPEINFILSGDVRPVADLSASVIRLTGSAGTEIRQIIRISPVAENRFRITGIAPEDGRNLKYELIETTSGEAPAYELTVFNLKPDKGWYRDKFHILTDSTISPEILIPVFGYIRE